MKHLIHKLLKSQFIRKTMIMISGTAGSQAIILLASPFITRLYGPEAFGVLGVFMAVSAIMIPASVFGYPIAIVLPKEDKEAVALTKISLLLSVAVTSFTLIIVWAFGEELLSLFNFAEINDYIFFIPLVIFFGGLLQIFQQWSLRLQEFSVIAKANLYYSFMVQGGIVGIGLFYPVALILITMNTLGRFFKIIFLVIGNMKKRDLKEIYQGPIPSLKTIAYKYKNFPTYRAPEMLISGLSQNIPIVLLSSMFGPAAAGFFTLGRRVMAAPTTIIGKAVGDVFYPRINQAYHSQENLQHLIKKSTFFLAIAGFIPFGLVIIFGPLFFEFVFGSEWKKAGEYARWIALAAFFGFINQPSVKSLPVLSALRFHLVFTIILLLVRVSALFVGSFVFNDDLVAIALFSSSGAILNLLLIIMTIKISGKFNSFSKS
ncbi:lipopolysaccharide biosynthesis protein [Salimicrobium jeotgali]|uniref:lipopolysaccharide biosynthesis protein n=1 Tax=Salimicrobium jeotgali TaxID=1230341 RepID=UPI000C8270C9|nr:oligosaccharide flippase family protein [Salimicrobium jeotgali]